MPDQEDQFDATQNTRKHDPRAAPVTPASGEIAGDTTGSALAFCDQIDKDAREEIEKILGRARLSVTRKLEEGEKRADTVARQLTGAAEAQAERISATMMSGVSLEMKKTILRAQGDIIDDVFQKVKATLKQMGHTPEYLHFLRELTVQAIIVLEEEECLLAPGSEDRELYSPELVQEIGQLVERKTGKPVKLSLSPDLSPEGSGVRVYSGGRRTLFDNTLSARMERLEDELKTLVASEVFPSHPGARQAQTDAEKAQESSSMGES